MSDGRKRTARALATVCITTLGAGTLFASPAAAAPDLDAAIGAAQNRTERLDGKANRADQRLQRARKQLRGAQVRVGVLQNDLRRREAQAAQRAVAANPAVTSPVAVEDPVAGQALLENPERLLDRVSTVAAFEDQSAKAMAGLASEARTLAEQQAGAHARLARFAVAKERLAAEKKQVTAKAADADAALAKLKKRAREQAAREQAAREQAAREQAAREQAAREAAAREAAAREAAAAEAAAEEAAAEEAATSGGSSADPTSSAPAASGGAAAAVAYAMAQVGDSYSYGASGPDAFDCSGLTSMAWAQAGVSLPRTSGAQLGAGSPVSQSELQPGDLVFYYSPVSHVGIYVGNGQLVHAANPSTGVSMTSVNSMPFAGAVRPG